MQSYEDEGRGGVVAFISLVSNKSATFTCLLPTYGPQEFGFLTVVPLTLKCKVIRRLQTLFLLRRITYCFPLLFLRRITYCFPLAFHLRLSFHWNNQNWFTAFARSNVSPSFTTHPENLPSYYIRMFSIISGVLLQTTNGDLFIYLN
jgi:hypothetical protein